MSKSLAIVGGDLAIQGRSFQTVKGRDKLVQDLTSWFLYPLGGDPLTPTYGSTIEGAFQNGQEIPGLIGGVARSQSLLDLKAEFADMLDQYQADQLAKIQSEVIQYQGQTTLDPDEVIKSVDSIVVSQDQDVILVGITLTTLDNTQFQLTIPIQS